MLLDAFAHLPKLKKLNVGCYRAFWDHAFDPEVAKAEIADFKPIQGLSYTEEVEIGYQLYMLQKVGGQPVRYSCVDDKMWFIRFAM